MIDIMGAASGSAARVFGCFFLGLALGAVAGGRLAAQTRRPWRWIASAELGVALLSLPLAFLPWWADGIWPLLGPERVTGPAGGTVKTFLSVLLVLPPATMMGFFLPLAVAGWPGDGPRRDPGLRLYILNTFGAVAGILLVTLWLPRAFGIFAAMMLVVGGNFVSSLLYLWIDTRMDPFPVPVSPSGPDVSGKPASHLLVLSALSGGLVLGTEVIALATVQWVAPLSFFAPGAILSTFIFLLALSSFGVEAWTKRTRPGGLALSGTGFLAGGFLVATPFLYHLIAPAFPAGAAAGSLGIFFTRVVLFTLFAFGPAVLAAGLWFPLAAHGAAESVPGNPGKAWGWMLAANGVGGLLGAELTLQFVMPMAGPFAGLGGLGLVYMVAGWLFLPQSKSTFFKAGSLAAIGLAFVVTRQLLPSLPTVNPAFAPHVVSETHGREGSVVVVEKPGLGKAILLQNQYILGSSSAVAEQERQAHIPLLLHPNPARVGFIGAGTGISPGAALAHRAVRELRTAEISRAVTRAAKEWFAEENRNWLSDPRSRVVVEDGRTWVAAHEDAFDVLVSDLFLPWGPGEGRLYTVEHFRACRRSLREGGLFCLWLPLYQLTEEQLLVILRSFLEVFGEADLLLREGEGDSPVLGVFGWKHASLGFSIAANRNLEESLCPDLEVGAETLRSLHLGNISILPAGIPLNTLDNLRVELSAGRHRAIHGDKADYLDRGETRRLLESTGKR